jgi:hypothetical protein
MFSRWLNEVVYEGRAPQLGHAHQVVTIKAMHRA